MRFSRNEEGMLVRGGQEDDDESDEEEDEGRDAMNVDEEVSEEEPEEETFRREMRQRRDKKYLKKDNHLGFCKKNKSCTKGVSRMIYKEAKHHSRLQDFMKMK
ncbi:hypothetical protein M9H77_30035 [Catharanthus roseus]|uniref:Uncharacterized protein n=1 Tax=Catharanthus roseus TaxID=4058 RepID=A0ACB9ZYC2_CATRO|nr:hypothetical protein M9H77_30035 [Catharanthus roseus]